MTTSIGDFIAGTATSAFRSIGGIQAVVAVRPPAWPAPVPRPGAALPVRDVALVKIELNFNR
jgi:hypothetical protein